jgi:hypothetical protein
MVDGYCPLPLFTASHRRIPVRDPGRYKYLGALTALYLPAPPTAAQPTSLSWRLVRPSPTFENRVTWRLLPIPPAPAVFYQ